jgi:hypothetical protein
MTSLVFEALGPWLGWGTAYTEAVVDMDIKKAFMVTAAAFLVLSMWHNPTGTANAFGDFLGNVGSFLEDAIDKFTEFFRGLTA